MAGACRPFQAAQAQAQAQAQAHMRAQAAAKAQATVAAQAQATAAAQAEAKRAGDLKVSNAPVDVVSLPPPPLGLEWPARSDVRLHTHEPSYQWTFIACCGCCDFVVVCLVM